jgi:hypothetical protein
MNAREALAVLDKVRDLLEKPEVADDALADLDGFLDYDELYCVLDAADHWVNDAMEMISRAASAQLMALVAERENDRYAASIVA